MFFAESLIDFRNATHLLTNGSCICTIRMFHSPSLISSFAEMLAQDLVFGGSLLQCVSCGTPFVSSAYQAAYCSKTCRLRDRKRRLRAQMKEARALRSQGQTTKQIAATLGQDRKIVRGWVSKSTTRPGRSPGDGSAART
jgi:hypothetical protein